MAPGATGSGDGLSDSEAGAAIQDAPMDGVEQGSAVSALLKVSGGVSSMASGLRSPLLLGTPRPGIFRHG